MLKVPLLRTLAQDAYAEGHRVVIFCNFEETRAALCEKLETKCTIHGAQVGVSGAAQRQEAIDRFQSNIEPYIVVNIKAGGVGTSLHDPLGQVPRTALVCPTFSATDLRQALGRVRRAGGAHSVQRIVFVAGTIEEGAARAAQRKLHNLDTLNDGDLYTLPRAV
jgi:superfamily II DNA or RNA helicase